MALASDVPRIVDAMLRGYVKAVVGKGLRALMVVEPDPAGEMRVTWAKRLNVRQIAQMVCEIMSGFRDSNGRLTKVPGRRPPSETDINQIDTDVRAAILDLLWRPAITLPPFRMVLATRRCFLVTTTELAQVTVIDRDSVMDSDLVVGRSQLAVPENPLSDVALGFEAGGGHFTDACRRFFILNDIEDRIRWVILKGAFRITDTSGLNLFVSESGGGKTSMIRLMASVIGNAAFSSLDALAAAGSNFGASSSEDGWEMAIDSDAMVITEITSSSESLPLSGSNLQEGVRNDVVTYSAKWKRRTRYPPSLTWLGTSNQCLGDQPGHIYARVTTFVVSRSLSLKQIRSATWVEDTLASYPCHIHQFFLDPASQPAPLWVREQKPLSCVMAVDVSADSNTDYIVAFNSKVGRTYNPDDIVSVKAVWSRIFPDIAYPEAIEIGLHSSSGYIVEAGELYAMGYRWL